MKQIRLTKVRLAGDNIEVNAVTSDGHPTDFKLSMNDFILLRLQLDEQAQQAKEESDPLRPRAIQVIDPDQLTVFPDPLSGDPILRFGVRALGNLTLRIPKGAGATALAQQLLPYLSPAAGAPSRN